ncbi:MAG TPA: hypothetical protein VMB50_22760 [Myxococcales bacterium]|nr:hypothetical protein [Myxococcales bacterium]
MRHPFAVLAAALALAACSKAKDEAHDAIATAVLNHALSQNGTKVDVGSMSAMQQQMKDLATPLKRDIVSFKKLTPLLPEAPAGWTAEVPEGRTLDNPQLKLTEASRVYKKGNATMTLKISDGMSSALAGMAMLAGMTEESSTGYRKPYNVAGGLGTEQWTNAGKSSEIMLITKNRLLITVEGSNLDSAQVGKDLIAKLDPAKVDAVVQ